MENSVCQKLFLQQFYRDLKCPNLKTLANQDSSVDVNTGPHYQEELTEEQLL